ncbi:MAG: phosphotransferase [Enterobacteriaceae bacterium]
MDNLKAELGVALGESLSHMEQIREYSYAHLYQLYNQQGSTLPVIAKTYFCEGIAGQEAYKLSLLAREGITRVPAVYGIVNLTRAPYQELLLLERLPGIYADDPKADSGHNHCLLEQVVDSLLAWHRLDSRGWVGMVDMCHEGKWLEWYQRYLCSLWQGVQQQERTPFASDEFRILARSLQQLNELFFDFDDNAVLVHGNLTLRSILKDPDSQQLVAMINPGIMLWAPREYELFRLSVQGLPAQLLSSYLRRAPVADSFMARRWLYLAWELVARFLRVGQLDEALFKQTCQHLHPWLAK